MSIKIFSDQDVKGMLILKMFHLGFLSEKQALESIEYPRPKGRNRQKKKYLIKLIEQIKKYDQLYPDHLKEMIEETENKLREDLSGKAALE